MKSLIVTIATIAAVMMLTMSSAIAQEIKLVQCYYAPNCEGPSFIAFGPEECCVEGGKSGQSFLKFQSDECNICQK